MNTLCQNYKIVKLFFLSVTSEHFISVLMSCERFLSVVSGALLVETVNILEYSCKGRTGGLGIHLSASNLSQIEFLWVEDGLGLRLYLPNISFKMLYFLTWRSVTGMVGGCKKINRMKSSLPCAKINTTVNI